MTAMNDIRWWLRVGVLGVSALAGTVWWMNAGSAEVKDSGEAVARTPVPALGGGGRGFLTVGGEGASAEAEVGPVAEDQARRPAPLAGWQGADEGAQAGASSMSAAEVWSHYEPTREELSYRAQVIEQQAERELRRLVQVLDLTEERQDRVFAALVRSSEWYHPSLQAAGSSGRPISPGRDAIAGSEAGEGRSPGDPLRAEAAGGATAAPEGAASVSPLVLAELTPEEAGVYERYTSERAAFWAGVVEDAERQLQAVP
jgi:hypothetical protein